MKVKPAGAVDGLLVKEHDTAGQFLVGEFGVAEVVRSSNQDLWGGSERVGWVWGGQRSTQEEQKVSMG